MTTRNPQTDPFPFERPARRACHDRRCRRCWTFCASTGVCAGRKKAARKGLWRLHVLVGRLLDGKLKYESVNACIRFVASLDGCLW